MYPVAPVRKIRMAGRNSLHHNSLVARDTLIDFFRDLAAARGEFLVYDDGFRSRTFSYDQVGRAASGFASRLYGAGLRKGDKVVFWSENRPEWIIAFWGCLLGGVIVVPIDYRASADFLARVSRIVAAKLVLVGQDLPALGADVGVPIWRLHEIDWHEATPPAVAIGRDDVAEIIFTSGATADPKGVLITHRNVLANIVPVEREMAKYLKWAKPFLPIRFLNLLPLSHMFGQAMATFIPPMLPGTVIFMRGFSPVDIVAQIKSRRVSVLVSVPKILDVLKEYVARALPEGFGAETPKKRRWWMRWWHYRRIHRLFGLKFWSFVVGAAPLEPELESFWNELGFVVVQGYGLTETAPIVSLNHIPGVRDSAVVGVSTGGEERAHAVLVVDPGTDPDAVVRQANAKLEDHQKVRRALIWPEPELPRTEGTRKLKRAAIREWVRTGAAPRAPKAGDDALASLVAKYAGRSDVSAATTLEELGLSSLERVELMVALEDTFQTRIDESAFSEARDLGQLRELVARATVSAAPPAEPVDFPAWTRTRPARLIRRVSLPTWILPLARVFAWLRVEGLAHLRDLDAPVIFAANHQSFMDGPVIMAALPARWRYRVAPAMAKEMFAAHFFPEQHQRGAWFRKSLEYYLAVLFFNAFPLPQREAGARQTLRYIGELLGEKTSVLIFRKAIVRRPAKSTRSGPASA